MQRKPRKCEPHQLRRVPFSASGAEGTTAVSFRMFQELVPQERPLGRPLGIPNVGRPLRAMPMLQQVAHPTAWWCETHRAMNWWAPQSTLAGRGYGVSPGDGGGRSLGIHGLQRTPCPMLKSVCAVLLAGQRRRTRADWAQLGCLLGPPRPLTAPSWGRDAPLRQSLSQHTGQNKLAGRERRRSSPSSRSFNRQPRGAADSC